MYFVYTRIWGLYLSRSLCTLYLLAFEAIPLVEFLYLVFTRIWGYPSRGVSVPCIYSHARWVTIGDWGPAVVFVWRLLSAINNSLAVWFRTGALGLVLFHTVTKSTHCMFSSSVCSQTPSACWSRRKSCRRRWSNASWPSGWRRRDRAGCGGIGQRMTLRSCSRTRPCGQGTWRPGHWGLFVSSECFSRRLPCGDGVKTIGQFCLSLS